MPQSISKIRRPFNSQKKATHPLTPKTVCRIIRPMKKHRRTGRPVGRPPTLPFDLSEQILHDLESRMDKTTPLVKPDIGNLARRLKVSRSSIKREIVSLRNSGYIELQHIRKHPADKISTILYKLTRSAPALIIPPILAHNPPSCGSQLPTVWLTTPLLMVQNPPLWLNSIVPQASLPDPL